jgi:hypothetical protein
MKKTDHPNTMAHGPIGNDQAAGVGSKDYGRMAAPYGTVTKGVKTNLKFYPLEGKHQEASKQVTDHGYQVYYAGGPHGKPDLATKNYNTKNLMIYDPSAGSGGDFGDTSYTDAWRKTHELAHALTYGDVNSLYGEGRRIGALGKHRTPREAKRAVHWEWLVAHKQRELAKQLGVHISDADFNRETNTVMHDAVHRAITGKFSEPGDEGFSPHPHKVPLETALGMIDQESKRLGLRHDDDLLQKSELVKFCSPDTELNLSVTTGSHMDAKTLKSELAKSLRSVVEAHAKTTTGLIASESRGLEKLNKSDIEKCGEIEKSDVEPAESSSCPGCGGESHELGPMGRRKHFMCKGCGLTHSRGEETPSKEVKKEELPAVKAADEKPRDGAVMPDDKKSKVVDAEGAGGDVSKGKMAKRETAFVKKPAADDIQAPISGGEKKAAGIGFLNGLISKFHGAGDKTWAKTGQTAPSPGAVARRTGSRMALAEMPHQNDGAKMQSNGTTVPMGKTTAEEANKEIKGFKSIFNNPTAFPKGKMSFTGGHTSVAGADKEIRGFKSLNLKPPMVKDEIPAAPKAPSAKATKPPKVAPVPTPKTPKVEGPKAPGATAKAEKKSDKKSKK